MVHGHLVSLAARFVLYEPGVTPSHAYFLTSGAASVVSSSEDGHSVEVEILGREGVVGAVHLIGPAAAPTQSFMQVPGSAIRLRLANLRRVFDDSPEIRDRILEFVQQQTFVLGQIAGCHRMHTADQRLARWLLMVDDRTDTGVMELTQDFLAGMIGSERTTVSTVAAGWQRSGTIEYSRGHIRILDRAALEDAACGCYAVAQQLFEGLYKSHALRQVSRPA